MAEGARVAPRIPSTGALLCSGGEKQRREGNKDDGFGLLHCVGEKRGEAMVGRIMRLGQLGWTGPPVLGLADWLLGQDGLFLFLS
jgi:hypothetical protein